MVNLFFYRKFNRKFNEHFLRIIYELLSEANGCFHKLKNLSVVEVSNFNCF